MAKKRRKKFGGGIPSSSKPKRSRVGSFFNTIREGVGGAKDAVTLGAGVAGGVAGEVLGNVAGDVVRTGANVVRGAGNLLKRDDTAGGGTEKAYEETPQGAPSNYLEEYVDPETESAASQAGRKASVRANESDDPFLSRTTGADPLTGRAAVERTAASEQAYGAAGGMAGPAPTRRDMAGQSIITGDTQNNPGQEVAETRRAIEQGWIDPDEGQDRIDELEDTGDDMANGNNDDDDTEETPPLFDKAAEAQRLEDLRSGTAETIPQYAQEPAKVGQGFDYRKMDDALKNSVAGQSGDLKSYKYNPEKGTYTLEAFGTTYERTPEQLSKELDISMEDMMGMDPSLQTQDDKIQQLSGLIPEGYSASAPPGKYYATVMPSEGKMFVYDQETGARIEVDAGSKERVQAGQAAASTFGADTATVTEGATQKAIPTDTYTSVDARRTGPTRAAQGRVTREAEAGEATLTERAVGAGRDATQEEEAMATAAQRPEAKDYAEAVTSDKEYIIQNPDDPDVIKRVGQEIGEEELERLRGIAKGRGIDLKDLPEFEPIATRTAQTGVAAQRQAQELGEAPEETAAQAEYYAADFTPQGGNTTIDETPAFQKAATREAQVGEAASRIAQELGTAPSVDLQGREAITGTSPQGDASQIGGIPTLAAAQLQAVTGTERATAAADMAEVVANLPAEVTAVVAEDPATLEAQLDTGADPQVTAAVAALPEEALVSVQMEGLLAGMEEGQTPAWARPAVAQIEQMMAARGMSASTVGRDALFNAIIQSALPMAQSNAQALQQRAQQNLSNEQQANLASAQSSMQIRMQNLANKQTAASQTAQMAQQVKMQQGQFRQEAAMTTAQQTQQTEMANFQAAQQRAQQESAQRQQTALANLDAGSRMDLANLEALNRAGSANLSADQQARLTSYQAQINKTMKQAELQQDMEKVNLSSALQMEATNLNNLNLAAKDTMTAEQQERLTNIQTLIDFKKSNAQMAQQMELANLSNDQQMRMAELQDRAATDAANFTADNQFELAGLNAKVQRAARQAELNQRMEEVNLDASLKVELAELTERNTTSRANMSAEQQTRLANLNVLVDFRKTNAQMAQQMDMANMNNEQQMELANLQERSAEDAANFTEANRFRMQELNTHVQVMSENEQLKQQADLANLSMEERISLANLTSRNQADSESMSAENTAELQKFEKKMQAATVNAQLAQQMGLANLSNEQEAGMFNAQIDANMDMRQFDANQQVQLANSQFMQTMTVKDMDNRQQAAMQNATAMASMDMQNADARTKASIANAQNFLAMDTANLNNRQQARVLDQQMKQQRLLSNQAAENAARQFNSTSINQTNQFNANMAQNMEQFNTTQKNSMEQFNATEKNRAKAINAQNQTEVSKANAQLLTQTRQFNAQVDFQREQWNAANAQAIEQSDVEWRRKANTMDTAAQNAVNQQNAQNTFAITQQAQSQIWQEVRDQATREYSRELTRDERAVAMANTALGSESFMTQDRFIEQRADLFALLERLTGLGLGGDE